MYTNREEMLKEVMAADFTVIDLNLYLDTHPCDQRSLALFSNIAQRAGMLREGYERQYGPLCSINSFSKYPWQWIQPPWPWE